MDNLQQHVADMRSASKVTDRRNAANRLLEYLSSGDTDACEVLDFNSVNSDKRGCDKMTWTRLFLEVRDYFVKETEKGNPSHVNRVFYFSVVDQVFSKATSNRPWLQWSKVIDFIVGHLQKERHAVMYGPLLIRMLKQFLSIDFYTAVIDATSWIDLIKVLIKCYNKYEIPKPQILDCMKICVNHGSDHADVVPFLRSRVVKFYMNIIDKDRNDVRQSLVQYLQGLTILCEKNAIEFRVILCSLGENLISLILQQLSFSKEEEEALVEFLLVQYRLHMPCDSELNSQAFCAHDKNAWIETLKLMYSYCIENIEEIALKRTTINKKDFQVDAVLLILAAKCTKQISSSLINDSESPDEADSRVIKRKMRYKSFDTIINDFCRQPLTEGSMVWIGYITSVLNEFPEMASKNNISNLIHKGTSMFNTSFMIRKEFYLFFVSLLKAEKYLVQCQVNAAMADTWDTVWDLTIKSISISEDKVEATNLLRLILNDVQPKNLTSLLNLFMNNSMPFIESSVKLIADYLVRCSLPVQISSCNGPSQPFGVNEEITVSSCPRLALMRWLMKMANEDITGMEPLIASVMCSLVVKQSHILLRWHSQPNPFDVSYVDFEKNLMKISFIHYKTKTCTAFDQSTDIPKESFNFIVEQRLAERLADALLMDFEKMPKLEAMFLSPSIVQIQIVYKKLISKINVYLNVLNLMENHSIGESGPAGYKVSIEKMFESGILQLNEFMNECFTSKCDLFASTPERATSLIRITRGIFTYDDSYCDKIKKTLSRRISQQTQEYIKKMFRSNLARYVERSINNHHETILFTDDELESRLGNLRVQNAAELELITRPNRLECERASIEALRALIEYGKICDHRLEFFNEIVKDLCSETFCSANQFLFDACADFITELANVVTAPGLQDLVGGFIALLQKCCRGYHQVPQCEEKLWKLFKELVPVVAPIDNVNRKYFMILVGTLYTIWVDPKDVDKVPLPSRVTNKVYKQAFEAFCELGKYDRTLSWSEFKPRNSEPVLVLELLHTFLNVQSQQIRLYAVDAICCMYQHAEPFEYSEGMMSSQEPDTPSDDHQWKRKDYLDKTLFQKLLNSFDIADDLSSDEIKEESVNRSSTALSCITRLIFGFPYLQKQNIIHLFLLFKLKKIDVGLAQRALKYASATSAKTMCCYLSYIVRKILKLKLTVEDIPFEFFGCENFHSFLTKFRNEICVEYFEQDKMAELEEIGNRHNFRLRFLVQECYGLLMARLTPGLAIYKYKLQPPMMNIMASNDIHKRLIATLGGKEATETLLAACLGDVVLNLISLVFEPTIMNDWNCYEVKLAEPVPPHYPASTVETCLEFLKDASPHRNISVIGYLAKTSAQCIYKILLALTTRIHNAHDELERFWRLHQFSFFVNNLLLREASQVFGYMKEYVCSFVFTTYLRLLKVEGKDYIHEVGFRKVLIILLTKLTNTITEEHPDEMAVYFNPVIRGLVSAALKDHELIECVIPVLDFLMKDHGATFASSIESLDPFPESVSEFNDYSTIHRDKKYGNRRNEWPLQKELEKLLMEIDGPNGCCTKEGLQFLRGLLSQRKRDLDRMVKNLEGKRFSDECAKDPLHNIIQMLVGVTLRNRDDEMKLEACRCLGEIGPVDLSVLVLPTYKSQGRISNMSVAMIEIVKILARYLTSDDILLVAVSGKVLRNLCEYVEFANLFQSELKGERLEKVLLPFKCERHLKKSVEKVDANLLETKLGLNEMNESIDYKTWLVQLITGIIECFKANSTLATEFTPLCQLRVDFSEDILPYVVYMCLHGGRTNILVKNIWSSYFKTFLGKFSASLKYITEPSRSITPSSSGTASTSIFLNKFALRSLLRVIQFLRRHPLPAEMSKGSVKLTPWDSNFWIDVNYLDLARAAQYCGAYLSSILFTEIAATNVDTNITSHSSEDVSDEDSQEPFYTQGATYPKSRAESSKIEKLLLKAYSSIGEADAAYGCGSARFTDARSSMYHMEQTMDWHRLLLLANGNCVDSESNQDPMAALSLKQLGLYNILWDYLKGVESKGGVLPEDLTHAQYECGWRLTKWDLNSDKPIFINDNVKSSSQWAFQMSIYDSIKSGLIKDKENHLKAVTNGLHSLQTELRHAALESSENIYTFLSRLQMLRVVEDFFEMESNPDQSVDVDRFVQKWKFQDRIPQSDFKYQEPILFLRNVLLRAYNDANERLNLGPQISESLLDLVAKSREAGRLDLADSCAKAMTALSSKPSVLKDFEVAKNHWAAKRPDVACHMMNKLIKKSSQEDDIYPNLLLLYGNWLSVSNSERPAMILEKYLQRSCSIYERKVGALQQDVFNAHIVLAKYADAQYQNVTKYIGSDIFTRKMEHYKQAKIEEEQIRNALDKDSKTSAHIIKKNNSYDHEEINLIKNQCKKFLLLALRHYLRGLKASNDQDLLIFRAIALWLEDGNAQDENLIGETTRIFTEEIMPSYKYIVVLHQLSARLGSKSGKVNDLLRGILMKCAEEHPYHALPVILTQASLHKDEEAPKKNSTTKLQLADRVSAAAKLVDSLKTNKRLKTLVVRMDTLWISLIALSNVQDGSRNVEGVKKPMPSNIFSHMTNLDMVAVPTSTIPVLPSGNYNDSVVGINEFGNTYGLVGGINSPKKITCRGSNGVLYNMLLKGQDDLRQDAVMQQVFSVMNRLLQVEPKTKARRLHIRTYKVIPLSQRSGLIEWVENTQTLGDYLVGSTGSPGAHDRYRPTDYKPMECRRRMMEARQCGDLEKKYSTYMTICEHFKPVFRHFFFENFQEAGVFFEKRLAYTRSVATTSIVGYILGLGDRHVLNILIDKTTAEFIHIDLGVAFEQGRILPTPETVPFRLTRDVIDGMGISGVEGVFRKSCEMTMNVLRNNAEVIITVLQVLLYDPLYMWTLTTDRVAKVQPSDSAKGGRKSKSNVESPPEDLTKDKNNSAARVLLRLKQKLVGIEEEGGAVGAISSGSSLSIDGHVALLIQRAMDSDKLCRLFPGWQPYL